MTDLSQLLNFLPCRTPEAWIEKALINLDLLLIDHATNELKAAQSAMTLMAKHPHKIDLLNKMSRLAREELRHFEQVLALLKKRGLSYQPLKPGRYAKALAKHIRKSQLEALVDTLIVGAIIEARSCERFETIAHYLDQELKPFYLSLLKSECRHYQDYLSLAQQYAKEPIDERVSFFLAIDEKSILTADTLFRFHSGVPTEIEYKAPQTIKAFEQTFRA